MPNDVLWNVDNYSTEEIDDTSFFIEALNHCGNQNTKDMKVVLEEASATTSKITDYNLGDWNRKWNSEWDSIIDEEKLKSNVLKSGKSMKPMKHVNTPEDLTKENQELREKLKYLSVHAKEMSELALKSEQSRIEAVTKYNQICLDAKAIGTFTNISNMEKLRQQIKELNEQVNKLVEKNMNTNTNSNKHVDLILNAIQRHKGQAISGCSHVENNTELWKCLD